MQRSFLARTFNAFTRGVLVASLIILALSFFKDADARPVHISDTAVALQRALNAYGAANQSVEQIDSLYKDNAYQLLWHGSDSAQRRNSALIRMVETLDNSGVPAIDYPLPQRQDHSATIDVEYDIAMSRVFLRLVTDLTRGRTSPSELGIEWDISRNDNDFTAIARRLLSATEFATTLESLHPQHRHYQLLRSALWHYQTISANGGWQSLPDNLLLKPGALDTQVSLLRERLTAESGNQQIINSAVPTLFDPALEQAVIRFQRLHGLNADGIVGRDTVAALNVSAEQRVEQISLNLERWRWLPRELGERHILVNSAEFTLALYDGGKPSLNMRVVVGKSQRQTPIVSKKMKYLVLNPTWTVPPKILHDDILPKLQAQPDYLQRKGMRIFDGWNANAAQISEDQVDWSRVSERSSPYKVQQSPGANNALGQIKFMFPNQHSVYIHDTPSRSLFSERVRAFSSGCVRIEQPFALAQALVKGSKKWAKGALQSTLDQGETTNVILKESVPVHLTYLTAWVSEQGELHFRNDVYKRDSRLQVALLNPTQRKVKENS